MNLRISPALRGCHFYLSAHRLLGPSLAPGRRLQSGRPEVRISCLTRVPLKGWPGCHSRA